MTISTDIDVLTHIRAKAVMYRGNQPGIQLNTMPPILSIVDWLDLEKEELFIDERSKFHTMTDEEFAVHGKALAEMYMKLILSV